MGDKITLTLIERTVRGKKVAHLRREGLVPGIVYGPGTDPIAVQVASNVLEKIYTAAGKHSPVHLLIGTKKKIALIKDVETDVQTRRISHISFHAVRANEPVLAEVPIQLIGEGESEAEKAGLIILQSLERIEVKALPMDLPDGLEVSIVALKDAGDRVTVGDLVVPEGVEIVDNDDGKSDDDEEEKPTIMDLVVATVYEPSALQAANDAAGGDAEDESEVESEKGEPAAADNTEADSSEAKKD